MNKKVVERIILLGAGASKVFGLETMQDLTKDLVEKMRAKGHDETIDDILSPYDVHEVYVDFISSKPRIVREKRGCHVGFKIPPVSYSFLHYFKRIKQF